jgi:hypothetical protein
MAVSYYQMVSVAVVSMGPAGVSVACAMGGSFNRRRETRPFIVGQDRDRGIIHSC